VTGGGAVEAALAIYLESFAKTLGSREQLAIAEFADALLVIPKTLAVNAGKVHDCPGFGFLLLCSIDMLPHVTVGYCRAAAGPFPMPCENSAGQQCC
jgi:TCP-1/cpn60 chaperonin family